MKQALQQPYKTFFGTLANQNRLEIIGALKKEGMNVTRICAATGLRQPTVSANLKRLEHCGFVAVKQNGKEREYSLNKKTIKPLLNLMHSHMRQYCSKVCEEV